MKKHIITLLILLVLMALVIFLLVFPSQHVVILLSLIICSLPVFLALKLIMDYPAFDELTKDLDLRYKSRFPPVLIGNVRGYEIKLGQMRSMGYLCTYIVVRHHCNIQNDILVHKREIISKIIGGIGGGIKLGYEPFDNYFVIKCEDEKYAREIIQKIQWKIITLKKSTPFWTAMPMIKIGKDHMHFRTTLTKNADEIKLLITTCIDIIKLIEQQ